MTTKLIRPVKPPHTVTSGYGYRTLNGKQQFHDGIDYIGSDYSVFAVCDGRVIKDFDAYSPVLAWTDGRHSAGNYIIIQHTIHDTPYFARYIHLGENFCSHGQHVEQGELIGFYANAGRSYGAHLHFDMYDKNWIKIDPTPVLIKGLKANNFIK